MRLCRRTFCLFALAGMLVASATGQGARMQDNMSSTSYVSESPKLQVIAHVDTFETFSQVRVERCLIFVT